MKRLILVFAIIILCVAGISAQTYTVYSTTKGVKVESTGSSQQAVNGMSLKAGDILVIPEGGSISILDKKTNDIYTSVSTGRYSVTKLKIEASRSAASKVGTLVNGSVGRFPHSGTSGARVYHEKGLINRALATYDPDGNMVEMDTTALAHYIVSRILQMQSDSIPVELTYGPKGEKGRFFRIENNMSHPIYFNVLNFKDGKVDIASLGQPNGSYVVLSGHALQREQSVPVDDNDVLLLVMTPCQYDLDAVIQNVNDCIQNPPSTIDNDNTPARVVFLQ